MKMWPLAMPIVWLGWLWVFVAALSVDAETTGYGQVGGEVVLRPPDDPLLQSIKQISWKEGPNKAMEWDGVGMPVDSFRQFQVRGHLNTSTGEMTVRGLWHNDSNFYTAEINHKMFPPVRLIVLSPVPVPTVNTSCDESTCKLTCKGNTAGAEPVTYTWKSDNNVVHISSVNQYTVHKDNSSSSNEFSCEIKNPVSWERSEPFLNPFNPSSKGGQKISTGIKVIIVRLTVVVLLSVIVLLVAFHKWKTVFQNSVLDTNGPVSPAVP